MLAHNVGKNGIDIERYNIPNNNNSIVIFFVLEKLIADVMLINR
jgi:hypothetical protein